DSTRRSRLDLAVLAPRRRSPRVLRRIRARAYPHSVSSSGVLPVARLTSTPQSKARSHKTIVGRERAAAGRYGAINCGTINRSTIARSTIVLRALLVLGAEVFEQVVVGLKRVRRRVRDRPGIRARIVDRDLDLEVS